MANILLLEPDTILGKQYSRALEAAGHRVSVCEDAQTAISQIDQLSPSLIILELLLPAHSGAEFLYELRSYSEWQAVPVIMLSRVSAAETGLTAKTRAELGIDQVLYKQDITLDKLVRLCGRIIEGDQ